MEELEGASKRLKVAHDDLEREYKDNLRRLKAARDEHERDSGEYIAAQDEWESSINERMAKLNERECRLYTWRRQGYCDSQCRW